MGFLYNFVNEKSREIAIISTSSACYRGRVVVIYGWIYDRSLVQLDSSAICSRVKAVRSQKYRGINVEIDHRARTTRFIAKCNVVNSRERCGELALCVQTPADIKINGIEDNGGDLSQRTPITGSLSMERYQSIRF